MIGNVTLTFHGVGQALTVTPLFMAWVWHCEKCEVKCSVPPKLPLWEWAMAGTAPDVAGWDLALGWHRRQVLPGRAVCAHSRTTAPAFEHIGGPVRGTWGRVSFIKRRLSPRPCTQLPGRRHTTDGKWSTLVWNVHVKCISELDVSSNQKRCPFPILTCLPRVGKVCLSGEKYSKQRIGTSEWKINSTVYPVEWTGSSLRQ